MTDWSLVLDRSEDRYYTLIAHMKGHQIIQYVVVSGYDPEQRFGEQWSAGHYFGMNLQNAIDFLHQDRQGG